jgi:hypothetical protein
MKSSILRAGVALVCALGLAACGGGDGDLTLGGAVYGVTKDGLVLQLNGANDTAVVSPYNQFYFEKRIATDDEFNVTVKSVPSNVEKCDINNPKARGNYYTVQQVSVVCTLKTHRLQVAVNGLTGSGLVIVNGTDRQPVSAGATSVEMAKVTEDVPYGVTVLTQPAGQTCTVANGTGTMRAVDLLGTVVVNCAASGT